MTSSAIVIFTATVEWRIWVAIQITLASETASKAPLSYGSSVRSISRKAALRKKNATTHTEGLILTIVLDYSNGVKNNLSFYSTKQKA